MPQAAKPLQDTIHAGKKAAKAAKPVKSAVKAVQDSANTLKDSAIVAKDSTKAAAVAVQKSAGSVSADTLNVDSLHKDSTKRGAPFEAPVDFKAADSLVYYAANKQVLLYGKGQVKSTPAALR